MGTSLEAEAIRQARRIEQARCVAICDAAAMYGVAGADLVSELVGDGVAIDESTRRLAVLAWRQYAALPHPPAGDGFDPCFAVAYPRSPWGAPHRERPSIAPPFWTELADDE